MALAIKSKPLPLRQDPDGTIRVGGTRVTLDTVVGAFSRGATAEQIVQQYSALDLADVYATIAYYLDNRSDVDAFLAQRRRDADVLRAEIEAKGDTRDIRERLLARRGRKRSESNG